ncbi:MAG TPA: DUF4956 domain-containing protein [Gemmatimonadaceae bacterium]
MVFLNHVIDAIAQGSDRPIRRMLAYYAIIGVIVAVLAYFLPDLMLSISAKGIGESSANGTQVLQDGLNGAKDAVGFTARSLGELAIMTSLILVGTLILMLPVTWVYMSARPVPGHNQAVVQTLIILPIVVAGIIIIVQNSLALAFSLAGVVGAVRFRTNLRDTRDLVYIFLSIGVGLAAGVQALAVGAILSLVFNVILLLTWRYDYGRNLLQPTAGSQWTEPLQALASPTGNYQIPDRDLVLSLTPANADVLADRFIRVKKVLGTNKKKARYNAVLTMTTDHVPEAQQSAEKVLQQNAKRWKLDEVVTNIGKPSEVYYIVRLKKSVTRDDLLTAIHETAGGMIETADLEIAEPAEKKDGDKG